jgi:hypothetical protein
MTPPGMSVAEVVIAVEHVPAGRPGVAGFDYRSQGE